MKTKNIILILAGSLLLAGCSDPYATLDKLNKQFPNSDIKTLPHLPCCFLIRDTNGVIYYFDSVNYSAPVILLNANKAENK